jgi:hypothetical protein
MDESQVLARLTKYSKRYKNIREAAASLGISKTYMGDILRGRRPVPDSVLAAIGLERVTGYRRVVAYKSAD